LDNAKSGESLRLTTSISGGSQPPLVLDLK
jgi:hypothetical protein